MSKALPRGRGDRAPPRKSPSASAPGFPREAILAWIAPAEGRAPHARKESITLTPTLPLLGHRLLGKAPVATQCLAIRPAVPCGRGDRVPPRKSPFASSPALSRKAVSHRLTLSEGRAPHARKDGMTQTRTRLLLVVAQWHAPGDYDMPRFASGLTMRTHRVRPSEKNALSAIPGRFPARPSRLR